MDRLKSVLAIADASVVWDIVIIGGGATGIGAAVDAASRGYKTLLVEQSDFGKGTSSKSTKLIHGGIRYLEQGNIALVLESLRERGVLRRNAPHLVTDLEFIVPYHHWFQGLYYGIGLKVYDFLSGKLRFGASRFLSKSETIIRIPTIDITGLKGGILYHDGQFDDARLLVSLAQTAQQHGATVINYMQVVSLLKADNSICGLEIEDQETLNRYTIKAKQVINATGVFTDAVRKMDDIHADSIMTSSQGIHIVLDKSFLPGKTAMMLPGTDDGRIFFIIPWQEKVIIGTTDTPIKNYNLEPVALDEEIAFLLEHTNRYLSKKATVKDIKSVFTGLRPLVTKRNVQNTAKISRNHEILVSSSGLISISGGKWTTYRKMAEDVINKAIEVAGLESKKSTTKDLKIYRLDANSFNKFLEEKSNYNMMLHPDYPFIEGQVVWAVRYEMVRSIEDFIARRIRLLFLDVEASIQIAPRVAELIAQELGCDSMWEQKQLDDFIELTKKYKYSN